MTNRPIKLVNEDGKIVGKDPETDETTPVEFAETAHELLEVDELRTGDLYTDAVTMYVDPNGDDANDGLSETSPKQHINAAIEDAPMHGDLSTMFTIRLADGNHVARDEDSNTVSLEDPPLTRIKLVSGTDTNGDPTATIDATGINSAINALRTHVILEDVAVHGGNVVLNSKYSSTIECYNVHATTDTDGDMAVYVQNGSQLNMGSDCVFDVTASSSPAFNVALVGCSTARIEGTLIGGGGSNGVVQGKEVSWLFLTGSCVIDGDGVNHFMVQAGDNSDVKIGGGATLQNGLGEALAFQNSNIKYHGSINVSNVDVDWKADKGSVVTTQEGETMEKVPHNNADPSVFGARHDGLTQFNKGDDLQKYYSWEVDDWIPTGLQEYADPAASDLAERERAFDTTHSRYLYKDTTGTVHYWAAGGTLYPPEYLPDGAISHWMLDSGGDVASDGIGSNDLTLNGPTLVEGDGAGDAHLSFDGIDDYGEGTETPITGSQNRTFVAWVRPTDISSNGVLADWGMDSSGGRWTFYAAREASDEGLRIEVFGSGESSDLIPSADQWQLVACILNGDTLGDHTLYLDGSTYSPTGTGTVDTGDTYSFNTGRRLNGDRHFAGDIGEMVVVDRALTVTELDDYRSQTASHYDL